ncbi:MAG: AAA family ATPase [Lentisphaerae bacterium]|nr:AAA family ATPase [Lentisphaerota bacterium]
MTNNELVVPNNVKADGVLSPVAVESLLKKEFPQVAQWLCWKSEKDPAKFALKCFTGEGNRSSGRIGVWRWERVPCSYCNTGLWGGDTRRQQIGTGWLGMIRVSNTAGQEFLLFSYLNDDKMDPVPYDFFASTGDLKLLRRFADDVRRLTVKRERSKVRINVYKGADIQLDAREMEPVLLPDAVHADIVSQATTFFRHARLYQDLGAPYRRGFPFAGPPGTGKSMMIHSLVRRCWKAYRAEPYFMNIRPDTDCDDLSMFFNWGSSSGPRVLILEEIDSLACETRVTRAALLSQLDKLDSKRGVLLIATSNNPEKIDPALIHRPSRFDRVWHFDVPDAGLRTVYLKRAFPTVTASVLEELVRLTGGWSFAYLKELRMTSAVIAAGNGGAEVTSAMALEAHRLLQSQFDASQQSHAYRSKRKGVAGFGDRLSPAA